MVKRGTRKGPLFAALALTVATSGCAKEDGPVAPPHLHSLERKAPIAEAAPVPQSESPIAETCHKVRRRLIRAGEDPRDPKNELAFDGCRERPRVSAEGLRAAILRIASEL